MRRDYFTLELSVAETSGLPTVDVTYDGPSEGLAGRLVDGSGEPLDADELDVAYRLRNDETGVVSVTNRVTGEFIIELNAENDAVFDFVRTAREHAADGRYQLKVSAGGEELLDHEKETLLVYDPTGELLRGESLIPSGVEL